MAYIKKSLKPYMSRTIIAPLKIWVVGWKAYKGVPYDYDYEYNEEEDTWWIPQGWYEVCDYLEDCPHVPIISEVIAWTGLPSVFEPNIK